MATDPRQAKAPLKACVAKVHANTDRKQVRVIWKFEPCLEFCLDVCFCPSKVTLMLSVCGNGANGSASVEH